MAAICCAVGLFSEAIDTHSQHLPDAEKKYLVIVFIIMNDT